MNDTLGSERIVASALVFSEYQWTKSLPELADAQDSLQTRAEIATSAQKQMENQMATLKVQQALEHRVPRAFDNVLEVRQEVLLWHEKIVENRIGEWIRPLPILAIDRAKKLEYLQDKKLEHHFLSARA